MEKCPLFQDFVPGLNVIFLFVMQMAPSVQLYHVVETLLQPVDLLSSQSMSKQADENPIPSSKQAGV